MKQAVFLDIDNTLLDFDKSADLAMHTVCDRFGIKAPAELFATFKRINDGLWLQIEQGIITKQDLFRVRWDRIFSELGVRFDGKTFEEAFLQVIVKTAVPVTGAADLLAYLDGKGYRLFAASNAPRGQQAERLAMAGLLSYFEAVFVSADLGAEKPSREFFDLCFARLNDLDPHDCVLIGDSISADIAGGNAYGMQTVWFNPAHTENPTAVTPTAVVSTLAEIQSLL